MNTIKLQKSELVEIFKKALNMCKPSLLTYRKLQQLNIKTAKNIHICGAGKASVEMARGVYNYFKEKIKGGIIISPFISENFGNIEILKGSHPLPDFDSIVSTKRLIEYLEQLEEEKDFLVFVLSGGASALLEYPCENISIDDLKIFNRILINSGMTINEINSLRKAISNVKNGRLTRFINCEAICLVLSDVVGDDLSTIGSGPLYKGENELNVEEIINKYKIDYIVKIINAKKNNKMDKLVKNIPHFIVGNNLTLLQQFKALLKQEKDINSEIITPYLIGEAKEVAKVIVSIGKYKRKPLIFGGETTVTVRGSGKGGRNQELCLAGLIELEKSNVKNFLLMSVASDGIDGNTDAAGAIVTFEDIRKYKNLNINPENYLFSNDSYNFFRKINSLIKIGATGNNLLDCTLINIMY